VKLLVVGGAGYIGSHMVRHLQQAGHAVVVADNFSTDYRDALKDVEVAELDIADAAALDAVFAADLALVIPRRMSRVCSGYGPV
jgi:UDP-glucose 4-epimerase